MWGTGVHVCVHRSFDFLSSYINFLVLADCSNDNKLMVCLGAAYPESGPIVSLSGVLQFDGDHAVMVFLVLCLPLWH